MVLAIPGYGLGGGQITNRVSIAIRTMNRCHKFGWLIEKYPLDETENRIIIRNGESWKLNQLKGR
jgi:hypothetical protein